MKASAWLRRVLAAACCVTLSSCVVDAFQGDACSGGTSRCQGDVLEVCDLGGWVMVRGCSSLGAVCLEEGGQARCASDPAGDAGNTTDTGQDAPADLGGEDVPEPDAPGADGDAEEDDGAPDASPDSGEDADPDVPPVCTQCEDLGSMCGQLRNSCDELLSCGECGGSQRCQQDPMGVGQCVSCASGTHDGGDGTCVPLWTCVPGYQDDGFGRCLQGTGCEGSMGRQNGRCTGIAQGSPLPQRLSGHTANLLVTGQVMVTGGALPDGSTAQTWLLDLASWTWAPGPSMGVPRARHSALTLPDGRLVLVGGGTSTSHGQIEVYDPIEGRWSAGPALGGPFGRGALVLLPSGEVAAVAPGQEALFLSPELALSREGGAVWSEGFDRAHAIYWPAIGGVVLGGVHDDEITPTYTLTLMDPETGELRDLPSPDEVFQRAVPVIYQDDLWLIGGIAGALDAARPCSVLTTNLAAGWTPCPIANFRRRTGHAANVTGGELVVTGGREIVADAVTERVYVWDAEALEWERYRDLDDARIDHVAVEVTVGRVLVIGGLNEQGQPLATTELISRQLLDP